VEEEVVMEVLEQVAMLVVVMELEDLVLLHFL
jgi:hypothetical protein